MPFALLPKVTSTTLATSCKLDAASIQSFENFSIAPALTSFASVEIRLPTELLKPFVLFVTVFIAVV